MSLFEQLDTHAPGAAVGDWHPTRYTPTLTGTEDFVTDGDKLLRFAGRWWSIPSVARFTLDAWQEWLIRHVLERYPDDWPVEHLRGQLRYRQVVISMGRQNGKSILGALFAIYFLVLHVRGPRVVGLASIDNQAKIVYDRVKYGIDNNPTLSRELRTTSTRGIHRRDGSGVYRTLPAKEESAQGEPVSGGIYDELHLGLSALWDALVLGQRAIRNALLIGLTTAGDDSSVLLLRLYDEGEAAIRGEDERFGFFLWEAPDDELTPANIVAANPAVACGRVDLAQAYADAVKMDADTRRGPDGLTGRQRRIRYTNNRFVRGAADAWANTHKWTNAPDLDGVTHGPIVYGIERTADWSWATVTASSKLDTPTGHRYATEVVASIARPTPDQLVEVCDVLAVKHPDATFAFCATTLADVADRVRETGRHVWKLAAREEVFATTHAREAIAREVVHHPRDPLLTLQMPRTRAKAVEGGARVSRSLSLDDCDAVLSMILGLYVAAVAEADTMQMW